MSVKILLNGEPLEPDDIIDIDVVNEAFEFHFIRKPIIPAPKPRRALRRSKVRRIPVDEYLKQG